MPSSLTRAISTAVAIAVAAFVLKKLFQVQSKKEARREGLHRVVEFGGALKAILCVGALFFLGAALLASYFPGKTDLAVLPWIVSFFLAFAGLSIYSVWIVDRSKILWNESEIRGADTWGRRGSLPWSALREIEFVRWAVAFRLRAEDGTCVLVYPMMQGYAEIQRRLQLEAGRLGEILWPSDWVTNMAAAGQALDVADYAAAEKHVLLALGETEGAYREDPRLSISNLALARIAHKQQELDKAESFYRRALDQAECAGGPTSVSLPEYLTGLAECLKDQGQLGEAEALCHRALILDEQNLGPNHLNVAADLSNLADLLVRQERLAAAEPLLRRANTIATAAFRAKIREAAPAVALSLHGLAELYLKQSRYDQAEKYGQETLEFITKNIGAKCPLIPTAVGTYIALLQKTGRQQEISRLKARYQRT